MTHRMQRSRQSQSGWRSALVLLVAVLSMGCLVVSPSTALAQQEGETVTVTGTITRYIDEDEVIFTDGTTSAEVEFKDDSVNLPPVNQLITMTVEIDKAEEKDNEYEVRLISWELADGATAAPDTPAPAPVVAIGATGGLLDGIPEPANAEYRAENAIGDGGRHFFYTTAAAPGDIVAGYQAALEAAGWTIESSGGGGDPFGMFGGGAGLTATNGDRYLTFNAGGPPGQTFIDACVWPARPADDNCDQNNRSGAGTMGTDGDLLAGVPEIGQAEFKAEDAIQEGGRHFFLTSSASPMDVIGSYQSALEAAGWTIESSGGGGDPFGMFGGGAGLTANDGTRYISVNAGGPGGQTFVDACIWPTKPSDTNCGQNNNDNAQFGGGGDLLANVPEPAGAQFQAEDAIQEGGRHFFYTTAQAAGETVSAYQNALQAAGWTIESSGGDPFGVFGGGLTATNGERYLTFNAGGPGGGQTFIDACVWPVQPQDNHCGQSQQTSGNATLGSGGDLLAGVPAPGNAEFKAEDAIQEGGRHFFYTSGDAPGDVVSNYQAALQSTGWTIVSSGGDPMGLFGGGLTATNGPRYLKLNAGGPPGSTFIDGCVWPRQPIDDNCGQNQQTSGAGSMGAGGDLLANLPELTNADFQSENAIHEGGRHFFFTSGAAPSDVVGGYQAALEGAGWTILSSGGGGDPFGLFGGGAGLTASDGARYLKLNAGGQAGGTIFVDACIWPTQPSDTDCDQNSRQSSGMGTMGDAGDLLAGVPALENAEFKAEDAIQEGGRHFFFTSGAGPADVISGYQAALESAGWTILSSGGGGDPFGMFGGGAGLTATDGARHLTLNAGGPAGQTFIDGCIWPGRPSNDNCGQNN